MWPFILIASSESLNYKHQSISPAKVREKPPDNAENRENGVWREGKFFHLPRKLHKRQGGPHLAISMSQMTETPATKYWVYLRHKLHKIIYFGEINFLYLLLVSKSFLKNK